MNQSHTRNENDHLHDVAYEFSLRLADLIFDLEKEAESQCPPGTAPRDYVCYAMLSQIGDPEILGSAVSDLPAERREGVLTIARCFYEKGIAAMEGTEPDDGNMAETAEEIGRNGRLIELLGKTEDES